MASLYGLHIEDPACRAVALAYCPWEEFLGMGRRYSSAIIPGFLDFWRDRRPDNESQT